MTSISIHAPLRGRPGVWACHSPGSDFNPRPLAGATGLHQRHGDNRQDFNPRPLAGATLIDIISHYVMSHFNPRPLAGATRQDHHGSIQ